MDYTIVRFIEENEEEEIISEVPTSWMESDDHCWWPSSKNVSILISKGISPDKNKWRKYPVAILGVADDYQKARWKADHVESDTSSSEKGRGKRKKKIKNVEENSDSTSDYDDIKEKFMSKFPEYPFIQSRFHSEINLEEESENQYKGSENQDDGLENPDDRSNNQDDSIQLLDDSGLEVHDVVQAKHTTQAGDAIEMANMTIINVSTDQLINDLAKYVKEEFVKTNRILAEILLEIQSINSNTASNTNLNLHDEDLENILAKLPIDNLDVLNDIDSRMERDLQFYKKVVLYFKTIGGITLKEKICRILKRTFSNKLIAQASWLGHSRGDRKNFQLSNIKVISAIKDAVNNDISYSEKDFERIAADWTRQGKQRKQREEKPNDK